MGLFMGLLGPRQPAGQPGAHHPAAMKADAIFNEFDAVYKAPKAQLLLLPPTTFETATVRLL